MQSGIVESTMPKFEDKLALYHKLGMPLYHIGAVAVLIAYPPTNKYVLIFVVSYLLQTLGISLGYHRLFSHLSFRANRAFEFFLALLCAYSGQGVIRRWVYAHRKHHRLTDKEGDPHSPYIRNFYWAHIGWRFVPETYREEVATHVFWKEWPKEIVLVDKLTPPLFLVTPLVLFLIGGTPLMGYACLIPTVVSWHITFLTNSLLHSKGGRTFETPDQSRNSFWIALIFWGEGWHNNHHARPKSARMSTKSYEPDLGFVLLKLLKKISVVKTLHEPGSARNQSLESVS